jgi:hypothetical protein
MKHLTLFPARSCGVEGGSEKSREKAPGKMSGDELFAEVGGHTTAMILISRGSTLLSRLHSTVAAWY